MVVVLSDLELVLIIAANIDLMSFLFDFKIFDKVKCEIQFISNNKWECYMKRDFTIQQISGTQ